jgi:AraC family transcriptional regulator
LGGSYAKFLHKGAYENFKDTYAYIFNEWLLESHYKLQDKLCFEIYLNRDPRKTKPENLKTEVYIPIG